MRAAEILRSIADRIDKANSAPGAKPENDATAEKIPAKRVELTPVPKPEEPEPVAPPTDTNVDTMVSPLQQKIELLKKAVGVENAFDEKSEPDELDIIKQNAGISPIIAFAAGSDLEDDDLYDNILSRE